MPRGGYPQRTVFTSIFLLLLATNCFAGKNSPTSEQGWVEIYSPHFKVLTDAGDKRGRDVALTFEQMRSLFGQIIMRDKINVPVPLQVVAYKNTFEMKQAFPSWKGRPLQQSGIFAAGTDRNFAALDISSDSWWSPVFHDFAHMLLDKNYPPTQPWFDEGLAEYISTVRIDRQQAVVGAIPDYARALLSSGNWYPVEQLFSISTKSPDLAESGDHHSIFYAESWLVFHYILDKHKLRETTQYFDLVMNRRVPVGQAIQTAFGMDAAQFDRELHNYLLSGNGINAQNTALPSGIEESTFTMHKLKDYEGELVIADMHAHVPDQQQRAIQEFQAAVQHAQELTEAVSDAERGTGYVYLSRGDMDNAGRHLKHAFDLGSEDARVYYLYALYLQKKWGTSGEDPEVLVEINQATEKALSIDMNLADAYNVKAFALAKARDHEQAAKLLRRAIALSPREDRYKLFLADELARTKKYDDALAYLGLLRNSNDPQIAAAAAQQAKTIAEWKDKPILQILADEKEVEAPQWRRKDGVGDKEELKAMEQAQSGEAPAGKSGTNDSRPTRYLKGTLSSVECAGDSATLHVTSGAKKYRFSVANTAHAVLIGADQFSCTWKNQSVSVNYKESGAAWGDVVSLEIR